MVIELEEIIGVGDRLVSIQRVRAKARHTGIELDYQVAYLWTFRGGRVIRQSDVPIVIHFFELVTIRDGKVRKIEYFRHRTDALQAAGMRE